MPSMLLRVIACRPGVLEDCLDIVIFQHDSSVVAPTFLSVLKLDLEKKSTYKCLRMFGIRACRQRIMRDIEATRRRLTVFLTAKQDRGRGVGQIHHPVQGGVGEVQSQPDLQLPQEQDVQHTQQNKGTTTVESLQWKI